MIKSSGYPKLRGEFATKGIKIKNVADFLGKYPSTIIEKLDGVSDFSITEAKMISQKYGIDIKVFFEDVVASVQQKEGL